MRAGRGGAGSAPSSVLQRAPAWLGVRTAPAAGGGGAGGAAANGSRGAAHVRAGPGRPRPLAPRAAAALRCRGPGAEVGPPGLSGGAAGAKRRAAKPEGCSRCAGKWNVVREPNKAATSSHCVASLLKYYHGEGGKLFHLSILSR